MATTTAIVPLTLLQAVNELLVSVGTARIMSLDTAAQDEEVATALQAISDVSVAVQTSGWHFNTDEDYPLQPNATDGSIAKPSNCVSVTVGRKSYNRFFTERQGKLYDLENHTYNWTTNVGTPAANQMPLSDGNLYVNIVWLFVFEDLPQAVRWYIMAKAANMWAVTRVPNMETYKFSESVLEDAYSAFVQYDQESRSQAPSENPHYAAMRRR